MTSERSLWHTMQRHLSPYGAFKRIESPLVAGIPDVVYCIDGRAGWLELKELDAWPARPTTALRIPNLRREQVLFAEGWTGPPAYGRADMLLQIGRDYLLLGPHAMRRVYERQAMRLEVELGASARGTGTFPTTAVVRALRHGPWRTDGVGPIY